MKLINKFIFATVFATVLGFAGYSSQTQAQSIDGSMEMLNAKDLEGFDYQLFYDQLFEFDIEGYEFRNTKSYPGDVKGLGLQANALNSFTERCIALEDQMANLDPPDLELVNCGEPRNIEASSIRRHFQSEAQLKINTAAMAAVSLGEVDAGYVDVSEFSSATYPWQASRNYGRQVHADMCDALEAEAYDQFGDTLLLFDCGLRSENGGKNGWHYSSEAVALVRVDISTIPMCSNGKLEQQTWYKKSSSTYTESYPCEFGGSQTDHYEKFDQYVCRDSFQVPTGHSYKGNYLYTINSCSSAKPLNCGMYSHGEAWWEKNGEISERVYCPHGGNRYDIYRRLTRARCYDGSVSYGSSKKGRYLRTEGKCRKRPMKPMPMKPMPMPMKPMPMPMPMKPMPMPMPMKPMPMPMPMKPMPMPMKPMPMPMPMKPMPMPMPMKPMPMPMPMPMKPMPMPMPMKPMPMPMPMKPMPMPMPMKPMPMPMPMKPMPMPMPMKPMPMPMPMKPMPMPMPMKPMPMPMPMPMKPMPMPMKPMPMPMKPMPMPMPMKPMPMKPMPMKPMPMKAKCPPGKVWKPGKKKCV